VTVQYPHRQHRRARSPCRQIALLAADLCAAGCATSAIPRRRCRKREPDPLRWRRSLTEEEQHKIAGAIVDHLESHNWKIEHGPPREGHGPHLVSKQIADANKQKETRSMSIAGQWITTYTGSNSGLFIAEFDEAGSHYEGTICVWDSKLGYPNSWVYISTESNSLPQHLRGLGLTHFDNLGVDLFPTTVDKLRENGIVQNLHVIWRTSIGTTGSATAPETKAKRDSELKPLSISTWEEFKEFVNTLDRTRYIFRGQGYNKWRLCTSFHGTRRASLNRYSTLDLNELHVIISAQTAMFDFNNPLQFAAFLNLAQHHGYPTPLLDWTRSPYVAAFFAFRALPKTPKYPLSRKTRIFKL
jgi:FRG domain